MKSKTITPVVLAGIIRNKNILLLKRAREPFKGLWSLPGGKVELNEFLTDALKREIIEETNLSLISMKFMGVVSELITDEQKIINGHLINVFLAEADRTKIKPSLEGKLKWFTPTEIKENKYKIIPTDFFIITKILFKRRSGAYVCLIRYEDKGYFLKKYEAI
jgi:ADP-ribose pyrophosphatase YjhB (NUDIX family)